MSDRVTSKKGMFDWYFKSNMLIRILIGLVLGAIVGIILGEAFAGNALKSVLAWFQPFGTIFVRLLKMIVMPIIISTLIVGAASISPAELGRIGIKIVLFYLLTSAFAVTIGLLMGNIFLSGLEMPVEEITRKALKQPSFVNTLTNIIPTNPLGAFAGGKVLPTIFFSIIFGIGISYLKISDDARIKKAGETLYMVFDGTAEVMYKVVRWVLEFAPIGVFALIAVVFAKQGSTAIESLGRVTLACYTGYILQIGLVYGILLTLNKLNVFRFLSGAKEAMITAFVTRSSGGTLPVTMKSADENLGVSRNVYSFTLPLGATINMDGTAIYQGVCAIFVSILALNAPLSMGQQITVVLTAVLASIGTAGVPGAGAIMLLLVLDSVGLSVESNAKAAGAYALILGIDAILDMGRTSVNVTGDMTGTSIIAKSEKEIDLAKW